MLRGVAPAEQNGSESKQIEYLPPFLHHFVETGKLPLPESPKPEESERP
jgi:hypothetical protein